jgi:hypothetical protein
METPRNRVAVGVLLLILGAVGGGLIVRYAIPAPQANSPPPPQPVDFERLSGKWAYPGAKVVGGGRGGLIGYYAVATTPDDIGKVAAHFKTLVGRDIPVEGTGGGGDGSATEASVSVVDSWSAGNPPRPRRLALAARTEAGYSATVVLYRGVDDELTHIAVTFAER